MNVNSALTHLLPCASPGLSSQLIMPSNPDDPIDPADIAADMHYVSQLTSHRQEKKRRHVVNHRCTSCGKVDRKNLRTCSICRSVFCFVLTCAFVTPEMTYFHQSGAVLQQRMPDCRLQRVPQARMRRLHPPTVHDCVPDRAYWTDHVCSGDSVCSWDARRGWVLGLGERCHEYGVSTTTRNLLSRADGHLHCAVCHH